eukprot:7970956-Pyramimonas_sp.AAC.1
MYKTKRFARDILILFCKKSGSSGTSSNRKPYTTQNKRFAREILEHNDEDNEALSSSSASSQSQG